MLHGATGAHDVDRVHAFPVAEVLDPALAPGLGAGAVPTVVIGEHPSPGERANAVNHQLEGIVDEGGLSLVAGDHGVHGYIGVVVGVKEAVECGREDFDPVLA